MLSFVEDACATLGGREGGTLYPSYAVHVSLFESSLSQFKEVLQKLVSQQDSITAPSDLDKYFSSIVLDTESLTIRQMSHPPQHLFATRYKEEVGYWFPSLSIHTDHDQEAYVLFGVYVEPEVAPAVLCHVMMSMLSCSPIVAAACIHLESSILQFFIPRHLAEPVTWKSWRFRLVFYKDTQVEFLPSDESERHQVLSAPMGSDEGAVSLVVVGDVAHIGMRHVKKFLSDVCCGAYRVLAGPE
eukprot:GILI01006341.1.p1 GENE.GILI01006341.1~~GILI01006341.1.p1  ORF type:complete len:243 (-),score=18.91 GILI01006341.1:83-811(-)